MTTISALRASWLLLTCLLPFPSGDDIPDSKLTSAQRWHMVGRLATHRSWYKDIGPTSDQHCNYHSWIIDIVPTSGRRCYFNVGELTLVKYWTDVVEPMLVCNHCTNIGSISDTAHFDANHKTIIEYSVYRKYEPEWYINKKSWSKRRKQTWCNESYLTTCCMVYKYYNVYFNSDVYKFKHWRL